MRLHFFLIGALLVAALAAGGAVRSSAAAGPTCAHWVSATGDDGGAGNRAAPFLTVARLLQSLHPGQTGCFAPGTVINEHVVIGTAGTKKAPITIRTAPSGALAVLVGGVEFSANSHDVVLSHVQIRSPATQVTPGIVMVRGFNDQVTNSFINGSDAVDRNQSCIVLDHAAQPVIDHDVIKSCARVGSDPSIYAAGVLDADSTGARITNNIIAQQPSDGVALAPTAEYSILSRNLIQNNDSGIYFGGDSGSASSNNIVVHNAIGPSASFSVHAAYTRGNPAGHGNVVANNCIWRAARGFGWASASEHGFAAGDNLNADPASAQCAAYRPSLHDGPGVKVPTAKTAQSIGSPSSKKALPSTKTLGTNLQLLAGGIAAGNRVTLVQPIVKGAVSGATLTVRCVRGCSLSEVVTAHGVKVALPMFAHAVVSVGDVVEVRATKPGFTGVFARFAVSLANPAKGVFVRQSTGCLSDGKAVACRKK